MRRIVIIAVATYAAVCLVVGLGQRRMIYFPTSEYHSIPTDVGLAFEEVMLETADGLSLVAWYVPAVEAKGSVLFCHGNAGNISDRLHGIRLFHDLGYHVLIFDYRGYGRSGGSPGELGTYADAEAAWRHLVDARQEQPGRVVIFGRSIGGAVAIELAVRRTPGALIVESTFTRLADIARIHYPLLPVALLLRHHYDSQSRVSELKCPKLFLHGRGDELIPLANGRALFAAAAEPKEFVETPGGHNTGGFSWSTVFTTRVATFLDGALSAAQP
ncbi:MAG: alpha/beta hydrolase [Planctomycetes bacterium]|nr:alpha/beta hydrolase [Planctomycetota bacterium]